MVHVGSRPKRPSVGNSSAGWELPPEVPFYSRLPVTGNELGVNCGILLYGASIICFLTYIQRSTGRFCHCLLIAVEPLLAKSLTLPEPKFQEYKVGILVFLPISQHIGGV